MQASPPPPPPLVDPPPSQPLLPATTTILLNNPDSVESSPRCRTVEPLPDDQPLLPSVPGAKLRLMCSYGGHIMPRPHDKSLSYVGGDTRMVAVDRHTSLKDLCARLSRTLLHGRPFTLKYQLPNEDLDNLITVTTDEDLDNMIEEYDRLASKPPSSSPSRLRVFIFFSKPDTAVSMGSLLDDAKCETWFVDALINSGIIERVVSDSAAVDECLVSLVDGVTAASGGSSNELEGNANVVAGDGKKEVKPLVDVHSVPGSPMVENNSSYGSSSSSSSMANLPPIRVRVDDNGGSRLQLVMEEQFAQMTFGTGGGVVKQDDGYGISSSCAAATVAAIAAPVVRMVTDGGTSDSVSRVVSDEDRSLDHQGAPAAGYRKPPLPLQLVQPRTFGGFGLPSPDSVASDSSVASANSFSKGVYYQEQVQASHVDNKAPSTLPNIKSDISDHSHGLQREQGQDLGYTSPKQMDQNQQLHQRQQQQQQQQQFVYIHHPSSTTGQVPMSSYYPVYAPPSHHQLHHPIGPTQYPVYVMPVGPTQPYNMTMQSNIADPNVVAAGMPLIPPTQSGAASASYKDGTPPIYPTKLPTPTLADVTPSVYKVPVTSNPAFVQIPSNQFQQQYVGLPQNIHHPTQPIAVAPSATTNYGYGQYGGPTIQDQLCYTQQQSTAPQLPQYQSMTPAEAAAALSDVSKQFPLDNIQQPSRTTQPV